MTILNGVMTKKHSKVHLTFAMLGNDASVNGRPEQPFGLPNCHPKLSPTSRRKLRTPRLGFVRKTPEAIHRLMDELPVDRTLGQTVAQHIASVHPRDAGEQAFVCELPDPKQVTQETLLCWRTNGFRGDRRKDRHGIDRQPKLEAKPALLAKAACFAGAGAPAQDLM